MLRVNKFHIGKIFTGQLARMDFFTDVLFIMTTYSCGDTGIMIISLIILFESSLYFILMPIRLMWKDDY